MNQEILTKKCSNLNCLHPIKHINEFHKDKSRMDGVYSYCKICVKEYQIKNKQHNNIIKKQHRLKNKENIKTYNKEYALQHRNKIRIRRKYRYYNDTVYKLLECIRNRQNKALKNNQKSGHAIDLLMCTIDEWKKHLESQFIEGMTWDNYGNKEGQWSIDHIIPCDFFKDYLSDPVEQYMCFRWQNTRPMWHIDNIKKSNKIILANVN